MTDQRERQRTATWMLCFASVLCPAPFFWAILTAPKPDGDWRLATVFLLFPGLPLVARTVMWWEHGAKKGDW